MFSRYQVEHTFLKHYLQAKINLGAQFGIEIINLIIKHLNQRGEQIYRGYIYNLKPKGLQKILNCVAAFVKNNTRFILIGSRKNKIEANLTDTGY